MVGLVGGSGAAYRRADHSKGHAGSARSIVMGVAVK